VCKRKESLAPNCTSWLKGHETEISNVGRDWNVQCSILYLFYGNKGGLVLPKLPKLPEKCCSITISVATVKES